MAQVSMQQVKELRDRTQAGLNDCRSALMESEGDMDKAVDIILNGCPRLRLGWIADIEAVQAVVIYGIQEITDNGEARQRAAQACVGRLPGSQAAVVFGAAGKGQKKEARQVSKHVLFF